MDLNEWKQGGVHSYRLGDETYGCWAHAQWAHFFRRFTVNVAYQPKHFAISPSFGFRPTFRVNNLWVLCSTTPANPDAKMSAFFVARETGLEFLVTQGRPFIPSLHFNPPSPPLFYTSGFGDTRIRYFAERGGLLDTSCNPFLPQCFTSKLISAFSDSTVV